MSLTVRRVVTGHDENGRAIVSIDETFKNVVQTRRGAHAAGFYVDGADEISTAPDRPCDRCGVDRQSFKTDRNVEMTRN